MKLLSMFLIVLGVAVLILGALELNTSLKMQKLSDVIGTENIHLPEDIAFVNLADRLTEFQNYRIIQSIAVSILCFIAASNFWKKK